MSQPAYATLTEAFKNKVIRFVENQDRAGLEAFVAKLDQRKFAAQELFNRNRSVKNGDAFGKLRFQYSYAKSVLNGMLREPKA